MDHLKVAKVNAQCPIAATQQNVDACFAAVGELGVAIW
jgi:hypothetical protein